MQSWSKVVQHIRIFTGWVTPVKNQGQCGACVAFATVAALEVCMAKAGASIRDLDVSEQKLIDCDRLESGGKAIDICSNGVKGLHWHLKYYRRQKEEVFWYSNIQNCDFRFISFF